MTTPDRESQKYWEGFLEKEGLGNLDNEKGFGEKIVNETYDIVEDTLTKGVFLDYKEQIEAEKDIQVEIDCIKMAIRLYDNETGDLIGEIHNSPYKDYKFYAEIHLYKQIEENYRGKGFGYILFDLYKKLSEERVEFLFPDIDFSRKRSVIHLYKKFGFIPTCKIVNGSYKSLSPEDQLLIEDLDRDDDEKLPHTIVLGKE